MKKTYLITPGAAATTYLEKLLGSKAVRGGNVKFNKHTRTPPGDGLIVYMYANPYDTIISFAKRGFLADDKACKNLGGDLKAMHKFLNLSTPSSQLANEHSTGLGRYLANEVDVFKFEDHFNTYLFRIDLPIIFVKFGCLVDGKIMQQIFRQVVLNNPASRVKHMKFEQYKYTPRQSQYTHADEDITKGLRSMYGDLSKYGDWMRRYMELPDLFTYNVGLLTWNVKSIFGN